MRRATYLIFAALLTLLCAPAALADRLDDFIEEQMKQRGVPGLSLAIIRDGKIVKARGYGLIEKDGKARGETSTLFQAESISKPVAAVAALRMVEAVIMINANDNSRLMSRILDIIAKEYEWPDYPGGAQ